MKKIAVLVFVFAVYAFGQCLGSPLSGRIGIKAGVNYGIFDPKDDDQNLTGMGFHIGFGMGLDILNTLALDLTPTFRTTKYGVTENNTTVSLSYTNLYLPVQLSLKAGLPVVAPYIGIGAAGNFQMGGKVKIEGEGVSFEWDIDNEDLEQDFFLIGAVGTQIKLVKMSVVPEISVNYNLTPSLVDENNPNNKVEGTNVDFHFSVGFYMSL
jgi:hypothetical protein